MSHTQTLEHWPIERLVLCENNPRTHSREQIAQIANSIREFGFTNPILVDSDGVIIAGHARLEAARSLQLTEVPLIVLAHLTPPQKALYRIADNQLALNATWDEEMLSRILSEAKEQGSNLELTGMGDDELRQLLVRSAACAPDPDAAPPKPPDPISLPGDIWVLGTHRVLCGDATSGAALEIVLAGEKAAMVFTDPPYNVNYAQAAAEGRGIENDNLGEGFEPFLLSACQAMMPLTDGGIYICMSSSELHTLKKAFTDAGGHWSTFLIWAKSNFTLGRSDYHRQYEPILYGWREGAKHYWCGDRTQSGVWFFNKPGRNDLHPTMKPVELVECAIGNSSRSREIVLDPFGGSGSTLIACERLGRRARLVELDPGYVDVIVNRWQDLTGSIAVLESSGQTFAAVTVERQRVQE